MSDMDATVAPHIRQERQRLHACRTAILNQQQELKNRLDILNCKFVALDADMAINTGKLARHVIYMICGTKRKEIGVTQDLDERMAEYRRQWGLEGHHLPIYRIIEELIDCTDQRAGEREQYRTGHYCVPHPGLDAIAPAMNAAHASEQPSVHRINGHKGGLAAARLGVGGWHSLTPEQHRAFSDGRLACPHCGREGHHAPMRRWHLDRCKHRPPEPATPPIAPPPERQLIRRPTV